MKAQFLRLPIHTRRRRTEIELLEERICSSSSNSGLQDEVPMACLGKGVICFFALCGLKFTAFVNPSMCFTFIESRRRHFAGTAF